MKQDMGMTEADARAALQKLSQPDRTRIMAQVERLQKFGLSEGKSMAVLAAIGAKMVEKPEWPWQYSVTTWF
jgi:hypothetical protein